MHVFNRGFSYPTQFLAVIRNATLVRAAESVETGKELPGKSYMLEGN